MPINKSVPLSPMSTMHNNDEEGESTAYPQPSAIASDTPVNQPPWWAESDYIPPSIQKFVEANAGLSLVCLSQLFFVLMNVTVKYFISSTNISIPSLILVRQGMTALGCVVTLYYLENPNPLLGPPEIRRMLCARGFFGTGGLISTYYSFQGLSVSDTTAIQFLTPTCLLILGFLVLKERPTRRELVAGVLCLGGVMLVSRPPFLFGRLAEDDDIDVPAGRVNLPNGQIEEPHHTSRAAGVAWAFVSVLCSSTAYLLIRSIGKRAHALHSMEYFAYFCCVLSLPVVLFVPGQGYMPESLSGLFFITLIGIFGFCGQTFLTLGLQREKAGRASLAIYTSVFFAIILELFIFHTLPSFLSLIGVSIILTSAAWVAVQGSKAQEVRVDEEAPVSRNPSPMPSPLFGPTSTRRGEHYSYSTVPTSEEQDTYFTSPGGATQNGSTLSVPAKGKPLIGKRRGSATSDFGSR